MIYKFDRIKKLLGGLQSFLHVLKIGKVNRRYAEYPEDFPNEKEENLSLK